MIGIMHCLQRLRHDHVVEGVRLVLLQPLLVQIDLDDVDASLDRLGHVVRVDLKAIAGDAAMFLQEAQQRAIPAAQIQDARFGLDPAHDDGKIRSQRHQAISRAMRSR